MSEELAQEEEVEQTAASQDDLDEQANIQQELEMEATQLANLKIRAKSLGIKHHPAIGAQKLSNKIGEHLAILEGKAAVGANEDAPAASNAAPVAAQLNNPAVKKALELAQPETERQRHARLRKESASMLRIVVANMNPNKKEWEGEMFTVSNSVVGTFKKFVPFGNDEGWYVPRIIVNAMKERKCQIFQTVKGPRGNKVRKGKLINEFNIEILPLLSHDELQELAQRQAMANNLED